MGKAINAFVEKQTEKQNDRNITKLHILDFNDPNGSREKVIVKERNKTPHQMVVLKVREVEYLRSKKVQNEDGTTRWITVSSKGYETVEEVLLPRDKARILETGAPAVVGSVVRDLRRKFNNDTE